MEKGRLSGGVATSVGVNDEAGAQRTENIENEGNNAVGVGFGYAQNAQDGQDIQSNQSTQSTQVSLKSQDVQNTSNDQVTQTSQGIQGSQFGAAPSLEGANRQALENTQSGATTNVQNGVQSTRTSSATASTGASSYDTQSTSAANLFANQPQMSSQINSRGDIVLKPVVEKKSLQISKPVIFGMTGIGIVLVILALVFATGGSQSKVDALTAFTDFRSYLLDGPAEDEVLVPVESNDSGENEDEDELDDEELVEGETVAQLEDLDRSDGRWFFEAVSESNASEEFVEQYYKNLEEKYAVFQEAVERGEYQAENKDEFKEFVYRYSEFLRLFLTYEKLDDLEKEVVDHYTSEGKENTEVFIDSIVSGYSTESTQGIANIIQEYLHQMLEFHIVYADMGCVDEDGVDGECVDEVIVYDLNWQERLDARQNEYLESSVEESLISYGGWLYDAIRDGANSIYAELGGEVTDSQNEGDEDFNDEEDENEDI